MMKRHYHLRDNEEPIPALYVELTRPGDKEPFLKDVLAPLDTGAPLTAIPSKYKDAASLKPHDFTPVRHGGYYEDRCPMYLARVIAEDCKPQTVDVIFLPTLQQPVIGRNLMRYWHTILDGPEGILEITES